MNRSRRALTALVAVASLTGLAACGGDDDDAADRPVSTPPASVIEGPTATVSPEVPEALRPAVGPMEVTGSPLPPLGGVAIDADPALGMPAPTLLGTNAAGVATRVDAATDGPTMVVFLAHWCPHCNAELPRLNELRDAGSLPADLNVVAVATASDPQRPNFPPGKWLADKDWTWPSLLDGADIDAGAWIGTSAYGVDGFPFITLIDGDGNVAARWSGESTGEEILARLTQYLPGI